MNFRMSDLFKSSDSRYTLKTAFMITLVPVLMLAFIIYSLWIMLILNISYFASNGIPLDAQYRDAFFSYLLRNQVDYLPYLGLFFVTVFFVGIFIAYLVLRSFNQLAEASDHLLLNDEKNISISGLSNQKLLIKLSLFIKEYCDSQKSGKKVSIPKYIEDIKGPALDWVFYFQFFCLIGILMAVTVVGINMFTTQLNESIIQSAVSMLKTKKGMQTFFSSQQEILDFILLVPTILSCLIYILIGKAIISRIEGVTFAYVRDIRDLARGNKGIRLKPRSDDPGQQAALAINKLLDQLHPEFTVNKVKATTNEEPEIDIIPEKA